MAVEVRGVDVAPDEDEDDGAGAGIAGECFVDGKTDMLDSGTTSK